MLFYKFIQKYLVVWYIQVLFMTSSNHGVFGIHVTFKIEFFSFHISE